MRKKKKQSVSPGLRKEGSDTNLIHKYFQSRGRYREKGGDTERSRR